MKSKMKNLKALLLFLAIIFANSHSQAYSTVQTIAANFSGNWQGQGRYFENGKFKSICSPFQIHFIQTTEILETISGEFNCHPLRVRSTPKKVQIKDGILVFNGQAIGTIDANEIQSSFWDTPLIGFHKYSLKKVNPGQIFYKESVTHKDGHEVYRIEGFMNSKDLPAHFP